MIYYIIYSLLKSSFLTSAICAVYNTAWTVHNFFSFCFSNWFKVFTFFCLYIYTCIYPWWGWRKMDSSCFYAYHSEFYLVQLNTHTDFGDLMQQLDHRTWEGDWGFIHKQEGSDITAQQEVQKLGCLLNVLRLTVPLQCIKCSVHYLVFVTRYTC